MNRIDSTIQHQDATAGSKGHAMAGARNCLPCNRNVFNQVGGGMFRFRGVPRVWHCAECKAKRAERMAGAGV